MSRLLLGACACVLLASCASYPNQSFQEDPAAMKAAENHYSLCLNEAAARLDDGRSEAAAIAPSVAGACYPQFLQIQIADGDAAREEWLREHASPNVIIMDRQDQTQQTQLATQAVQAHRRQTY